MNEMLQYNAKIDNIKKLTEKPSPRSQILDGIKYQDVVCPSNRILMLKWDDDASACVSTQTADKLTKLEWGIPRQNVTSVLSECFYHFTIHYDKPEKYDKQTVTKSIRQALYYGIPDNDPESHSWTFVNISKIDPYDEGNFLVTIGNEVLINSTSSQKITESLEKIDVRAYGFGDGGSCY